MNKVVRTSSILQHYEALFSHPLHLRPSLFHSSTILERSRRRPNWDNKYSNHYKKRVRKMKGKGPSLRDAGVYADELFKSWKYHDENYRPPYSRTDQWFTQEFRGRSRRTWSNPWSARSFDFSEDDETDVEDFEVEDMFHAAFGRKKHFCWSSTDEESEREYTSRYNARSERNWRYKFDDEDDSSEESNYSAANLTSSRQTLGLKATGPLCLEDVKNAYRSCALKWHPDRHQGSSKVVAEEKFKICSAAYQSLCDQMAS